MRSKPGGRQEEEHSGQRAQRTQVQGDAWHVRGAGGSELNERKKYTEEMRLARSEGPRGPQQGLGLYSEWDRSHWACAFQPGGDGGFIQAASLSITQSTSVTSLGLQPPRLKWPQSEDTSSLSRLLISCSKGGPDAGMLGKDKEHHKQGKRQSLRTAASQPLSGSVVPHSLAEPVASTLVLWPQSVTEVGHCHPLCKDELKTAGEESDIIRGR